MGKLTVGKLKEILKGYNDDAMVSIQAELEMHRESVFVEIEEFVNDEGFPDDEFKSESEFCLLIFDESDV